MNGLEDVIRFVKSYDNCRQFTRIDCKAMTVFNNYGSKIVYLVDRNGISMDYLGGGPENGRGEL